MVALLALGSLVLFVDSAREHLGWIVAAALAVFLVASFFAYHREQSRRLTALPGHITRMRKVTGLLNEQVLRDRRPLAYTDGAHFGPTLGAIWRSHADVEAALLDEYEAVEPQVAGARARVEQLITDTVQLDVDAGWDRRNMVRALRRFVDRALVDAQAAFRLEPKVIADEGGPIEQRLVLAWIGTENFVIWLSRDAEFPSLDEPQRAFDTVHESEEYTRAKLESRHARAAKKRALDALEKILGRDGYFPGDCTDLCHNPESNR